LSGSIFQWSIPAIDACPGRTPCCAVACYALRNHFLFRAVQERLEWNWSQAQMPGFVDRMVDEVYRKGCIVVRVHVAGDFATPGYTRKWVEIVTRSPQTTFFAYTRSWRVAKIEPYLRELAALPNLRLWYSTDRQTGWPEKIPQRVRVAYLQDSDESDGRADLVFRTLRFRRLALPVAPAVCPYDTVEGKDQGVTCGSCQKCWTPD
jgi:hypothetical protein